VVLSVKRRKVWLTPTTGVPCSKGAKTRNPLKLDGVPETTVPSSAASGPKLSILWGYIWIRYCCLTSFFPIVDTRLSCEDIARQSCTMVRRWRLFGDILRPGSPWRPISASHVQHVSDLHPKFAQRTGFKSCSRDSTTANAVVAEYKYVWRGNRIKSPSGFVQLSSELKKLLEVEEARDP